jgi:hypothetical protein
LVRSESDSRLLNKLVSDGITFGLTEKEALKYIEIEFGRPVSPKTWRRRKAYMMSEPSTQEWLNNFTRIGFVLHHRKQIDDIQKIQDDSLERYFRESIKEKPNEQLILQLKEDIRQNSKLLSEYGLGTPIISKIKAKLAELELQNAQRIPTGV